MADENLTGIELAKIAMMQIEFNRYRTLGTVEDFQRLVTEKNEGRLAELPCKVGDAIYVINFVDGEPDGDIEEKIIYSFLIRKDGRAYLKSDPWDGGICYADELGKIVGEPFGTGCWLTREEAERKLKEARHE